MPNPDWGALLRNPDFELFFQSDAVEGLVRESVKVCCDSDAPFEAVQLHRGRLEAVRMLEHLPELQVKREAAARGEPTAAEDEHPRRRWRQRLAESWERASRLLALDT